MYKAKEKMSYTMRKDEGRPKLQAAAAALRSELRSYERAGTHLYLDGHPETADEIARACLLSEDSAYMRDFIGDEHECITEIHFIKIAEDQVFQERKSSR